MATRPKKPLNPNDYQAQKKYWYAKLKQSGFDDIELSDTTLKLGSEQFRRARSMQGWQAKAAYYQMASNFLNDHRFANRLERIIWQYHSEGISVRDISITLNKAKTHRKMSKDIVWAIVNRLTKIMKKLYNE